jgi:hypothetical protein
MSLHGSVQGLLVAAWSLSCCLGELIGCFGLYVVISSLDSSMWVGRAWFLVSAWVSCCPLFLVVSVLICFGCYLDGPPLCMDEL